MMADDPPVLLDGKQPCREPNRTFPSCGGESTHARAFAAFLPKTSEGESPGEAKKWEKRKEDRSK